MSVFRATNATADDPPTPQPPYGDPFDGPTERLAGTRPEPAPRYARRGVALLAVGVAVLALLASTVASLVAWRALGEASAAPGAGPVRAGTPSAATPSGAPPSPAASDADPGPPGYTVSYAQEPLRIRIGCSSMMYLDLDEPRANADEESSDLRYDSRCGSEAPTLTLAAGARAGSQVRDSDTDAAGCDEAIRTSPLGPGAGVTVADGAVLCVLTAGTDAAPARMVLLEVTEVGADGAAGMRATSWTVA
jgi:hypothetical protein